MNTAILNLLLTYWKQIAVVSFVFIIFTSAYFYVLNSGREIERQQNEKIAQEREIKYNEQINQLGSERANLLDELDAYYSLPETSSVQTTTANRSGAEARFRCQSGAIQKALDKATITAELCYKQLEIDRE